MPESVSTASITGMVFSLIISAGLPLALFIACKMKTKAKVSSLFIGMGVFILFALILEQLLHMIVLSAAGTLITNNIWLYALYGGLAAGLFEETGRYLAMKYIMKNQLDKENSLMYGIGHGGIEAILVVGLAEISNLSIAMVINSGQAATIFAGLDEAALASLAPLWELPPYQFYLAGVERAAAILLHISLSYFVYRAVKDRKSTYYFAAVGLHFFVDAVTVAAGGFLPIIAVEAIVVIIIAVIAVMAGRMYMEEKQWKQKTTC